MKRIKGVCDPRGASGSRRPDRQPVVWEGTAKFAQRQRQLSPDQYEIVDVRTSDG